MLVFGEHYEVINTLNNATTPNHDVHLSMCAVDPVGRLWVSTHFYCGYELRWRWLCHFQRVSDHWRGVQLRYLWAKFSLCFFWCFVNEFLNLSVLNLLNQPSSATCLLTVMYISESRHGCFSFYSLAVTIGVLSRWLLAKLKDVHTFFFIFEWPGQSLTDGNLTPLSFPIVFHHSSA